jgi:non-heme chloroperoxidase
MMKALWSLAFLLIFAESAVAQDIQPTKVRVRGVELHYIEQGRGEPLILLHGGQGDYRAWDSQMKAYSKQYRVISYSRRYNFPNENPDIPADYSAYVDEEDLAAFIRELKLGPVHLVGTSIGAFAALVLAVEHPELVRSLVVAEPPVHRWVTDTASGAAAYGEFMANVHEPAGKAFRAGDDRGAMRILVDAFAGARRFDSLSPDGVASVMQNARFFKAITLSSDPYPMVPRDRVARMTIPVLIVTGENTMEIHKLVNDELARILPGAKRVTIPKAGHGSPRENPTAFNEAVLAFLGKDPSRDLAPSPQGR